MNIILDKSYLIGVRPEVITEILSKHHLIMSDTLFLEIMTSDDKSQIKKCFKKLPQKENPIDLIPHSHHLMRLEKTNHKCATPIENNILK